MVSPVVVKTFEHYSAARLRSTGFRGVAHAWNPLPVTRRHRQRLAETIIGLFKTEAIRRKGPWKNLEAVEFATLEWVDWFNHRRLLEPIVYVPPAE
jgi:transposase InsO family protein